MPRIASTKRIMCMYLCHSVDKAVVSVSPFVHTGKTFKPGVLGYLLRHTKL